MKTPSVPVTLLCVAFSAGFSLQESPANAQSSGLTLMASAVAQISTAQLAIEAQEKEGTEETGSPGARAVADRSPGDEAQEKEGEEETGSPAVVHSSLEAQEKEGAEETGSRGGGADPDRSPGAEAQEKEGVEETGSPGVVHSSFEAQEKEGDEEMGSRGVARSSLEAQEKEGAEESGSQGGGTDADRSPAAEAQEKEAGRALSQSELQSGCSRAIQASAKIAQVRGIDEGVDYQSLTKFGPWDDRNYGVTRADLALIPEKDQYLHNIPVFFKIYLRKEQPALREFYPRSALQYFQILHGGFMVNGKLYKEGLGLGYHGGRAAADATRAAKNEVILDLNVSGNEVSVEANPLNKLELVAGSNRSGGQTMYYSDDGGVTWNFSQTNPSSCCDPTIAWSSDGSRVYQADLSSSIGVRWAVSTDKGKTWGTMQVLTASGSDKEFIHVDHSATSPHLDNIYLTYHDSNVMQFARSTDMGGNFSSPIAFSAEPRGIGSDITTDAAGKIYYFYPALGGQGITLLTSTDGGITFGSSTQVALLNGLFDFPIPSMESRETFIYVSADVDVNTGDIYVAWTDETDDSVGGGTGSAANNHAWIQVAKSTDGGVTWAVLPHPHDATDLVSGTPIDRFHPWMDVAANGVVHIIYYDTRHSMNRTGVDLYYTFSTDGGTSWETEQRFSTETSDNLTDAQEWGDYNGLSVVLDNIVATWTDNRPSNDPVSADDKVAMAGRDDVSSVSSSVAGRSGRAVGDFNGDGFDDLAIGVPGESIGSIAGAGAVNVIYGTSSGLRAAGDQLWHQNTAGINGGAEAGDQFGASVAAGDFNGDGFVDLAIGVPSESIGSIAGAGAVNVIYGTSSGLRAAGDQLWHQNTAGINGGAEAGDQFGASVTAGDFNQDGFADLAIGVPAESVGSIAGAGAVNVIYGTSSGLRATGDQLWHQNTAGINGGAEVGDRFGTSVSAGDFDGDTFDDLAIGVPSESIGSIAGAGAVNVIYGTSSGLRATGDQLWHQNTAGINGGAEAGDQFGASVTAGDFDGDGFAELAIGVPSESIGTISGAGAVNVIYGTSAGLRATGDQLWHQDTAGINGGAESGDRFGSSL